MERVNVVCMKWGSKYSSQYVNNLANMVARHLSRPCRFVCLTDDRTGVDPSIECLPLPTIQIPESYDISPWRKLGMFSKHLGDLTGKTLFLDLDIIIVDAIDEFFDFSPKFSIIENWTQSGEGVGNSSVYCFTIGAHVDVLDHYNAHMDSVLKGYDNEQIYLSKKIGDIAFWPDAWCKSYKRHCIPRGLKKYFATPYIPDGAKIIVFHGDPNPPEAAVGGFYGSIRKFSKPAPWVANYWR